MPSKLPRAVLAERTGVVGAARKMKTATTMVTTTAPTMPNHGSKDVRFGVAVTAFLLKSPPAALITNAVTAAEPSDCSATRPARTVLR